ncbi:hypothetical protein ACFL6N_06265 [Thermodesulfobacteriota bacterium]
MAEKRRHNRFKVLGGPLLVESEQVGTIQNISQSGVLCQCLNVNHHPNPTSAETLCILCPSRNICMEDIPFNFVRNGIENNSFGFPSYKLCGIEFGTLSELQLSQLESFLDKFTI